MMNTLTITNLTCSYQQQNILQNLNLSIENDDIVCLLGASGCGIAGLIPLHSGKIYLQGKEIGHLEANQREIGLIFQDYALFPHLTVSENILFGLHQKPSPEQQKILQKMTSLVHLQGLEKRYPHELSGGQQQRVAIAKLLLLDEPFSNIDSQVRHQMIEEIRIILKQQHIPAIFVTHSKEEAFLFADKLAIMDKGVICQIGTPSQLYQQPNSPFIANFLGETNYLPCQYKEEGGYQSLFGYHSYLKISSDNKSYLLVRPEQIKIKIDGPGIGGKVIQQRFLGSHYRYLVQLEDFQINITSQKILSLGAKVKLSLSPTFEPIIFPYYL